MRAVFEISYTGRVTDYKDERGPRMFTGKILDP
jgi:hypothetical protein